VSRPRYATTHPDQRDCALYRIYVLDPRTNYTTTCLGYIGETAREPFIRFMEHLYDQPFGDTIVGKPQVDPRAFAGKGAVLTAERAAVEAERPLYNYEWNQGNPDRIPIPVARRQREERDRARGVPSPTWGPSCRPSAASGRQRGGRPRSYRWLRSRPALLAYLWLVLAVGLWLTAGHRAHGLAGAKFGAVGASLLFVAGWVVTPRRRRRRRRRR
jgi:hypothetical protein